MKIAHGLAALALSFVLILAIAPYWPGLSGPILLDSIVHLKKLGDFQEYSPWQRMFLLASMGSDSSPWLSRPVSFLTLLINDWDWPTEPWGFKYTNVMIHALNAVLVFWLLLKLTRITRHESHLAEAGPLTVLIAAGTAALWAAHPLQVSTVLYIIQRMTELGTLFTLAALIAFVSGRLRLPTHPGQGYGLMTAGLLLFVSLGFLSKQIAVLTFVYLLVIEFFLLRPLSIPAHRTYGAWLAILVGLPLLLIVAYLVSQADDFQRVYATLRDFSLEERLLTQPRVLLDYLASILIPHVEGSGLYHDDFPTSTGWLNPPSTLVAIGLLVILIAAAITLRRRSPVLAFGIAWFFAGHLLESTALPIELYFEHRNYLPMLGPLYALIYYAVSNARVLPRLTRTFAVLFIVFGVGLTSMNAWTWGSYERIATNWFEENPTSLRAIYRGTALMLQAGHYEAADRVLQRGLESQPESLTLRLMQINLQCRQGNPDAVDGAVKALHTSIPNGRLDLGIPPNARAVVQLVRKDRCPGLDLPGTRAWLRALLNHPQYQDPPFAPRIGQIGYNLNFLLARIHEARGDLGAAMNALDRAYGLFPYAGARVRQTRYLISAGLDDKAQEYLAMAREANQPRGRLTAPIDRWVPQEFDNRIAVLEAVLQAKRDSSSGGD